MNLYGQSSKVRFTAKFNRLFTVHNFYRWLCLGLMVIILLGPVPYWLTGIGQAAGSLSAEIIRQPDGTLISSPKAEALHRLVLPQRIERMLLYPLLLLSFQLSGGAAALREWLEHRTSQMMSSRKRAAGSPLRRHQRFSPGRWLPDTWRQRFNGPELLTAFLFVIGFQLALYLLYLPFNFYRGFIQAHQFGLSTQTGLGWLSDWGKSVLIALGTDGLLWTGFYGLMRLLPRRWPIPGGALLLAASIMVILVTPIVITPLFYEVHPLADPILRDRILAMAQRAGLEVDAVDVIDASAKTTEVNAYVTGFGDAQRIVLYDTLLNSYTADQVEVVLAHELGHWYYRHVLLGVLGLGAVGWIGLFGLRWLLQRTWQPLGLRGPADVAGLPYIIVLVYLASTLSLPFQNALSRFGERQADQFALTISQKPAAVVELFEQLAEQNLSLMDTPTWEKILFDTHPATAERIRMAETYENQSTPSRH